MLPTSNFGFLKAQDAQLAQLGALAERYFRHDPGTAVFKLRQFAELLSKTIAAHHALYLGERETFEETLRRLSYERIIPKEAADVFHALRKAGNKAAHETTGNHSDALLALKFARQLGIWFHRTYGKEPDFKPGPFVPPAEPIDATAPLREEIEALRRRVVESEDAASRARREAEEHARARQQQGEERAIWEELAKEAEAEKAQLVARLGEASAERAEFSRPLGLAEERQLYTSEASTSARLHAIQTAAERSPKSDMVDLLTRGETAATKIDLDEAATRALIDQQLRDNGWEADTKALRHGSGARPIKGRNLAIAEWPTASGPADYALFGGLTLLGVVEAKRKRKNVSAAIDQAERYSNGMGASEDFSFAGGGPWGTHKVPFVFAANGRSYLKQIETESGIWFRDTRRSANHRRALVNWPTPEGLSGRLEINQDAATAALKEMPFEFGFPLRDYQQDAIKAVEGALGAERRSMLLAMATGTGKTKLAIALLYRLLATKRFRRIGGHRPGLVKRCCHVRFRSHCGQELLTARISGQRGALR
jgi:type I restriction enzyme R subunit